MAQNDRLPGRGTDRSHDPDPGTGAIDGKARAHDPRWTWTDMNRRLHGWGPPRQPRATSPLGVHRDTDELFYVVSGRARVQLELAGGNALSS